MKKLFGLLWEKLDRRLAGLREQRFNNNRYDRNESRGEQEVKSFPAGEDYWPAVAKEILEASNGRRFFLNKAVILHLASEGSTLGYRLLEKIQDHPEGYDLLNKNQTPSWGSPFLLEKYPFLSPTTASHIANLLSITDAFGGEQYSSFIDFGGGYGGLARCLAQSYSGLRVSIVDILEMLSVQKKYLGSTMSSMEVFEFYNSADDIACESIDIFNASFSFSEVPLGQRKRIIDFILNKCQRAHIIFQNKFNGVDNIKYFQDISHIFLNNNWTVSVREYDWYGCDAVMLFVATRKDIPNRL